MSATVLLEGCLLALLAAGCASAVETTAPPDGGLAACAGDQQCGTPAQSCCVSPPVEGGTYNRLNDPKWPATVSSFRLDAFEVTVGRLRTFVEAYPGAKPKPGAGAHPKLAWSGWREEWDSKLPATRADLLKALVTLENSIPPPEPEVSLYIAWSDEPGPHETAAANLMTWYLAFAFCAWDGGRLPTGAEWNYAAVGGDEQRPYPWGDAAPDASRAVLRASPTAPLEGLLPVGSKPAGVGRFGQLDLNGNRFEWVLDADELMKDPNNVQLLLPCQDCARDESAVAVIRGLRNMSFFQEMGNIGVGKLAYSERPTTFHVAIGLRCARDLP